MIYGASRPHAAYIEQVLKDRGLRPPARCDLQIYVDSLSRPDALLAADLVRRLAMGAESPGEAEQLLREVREAALARQQPQEEGVARSGDHDAAAHGMPDAAVSGRRVHRAAERERVEKAAGTVAFLRRHGVHIYGKGAALKVELALLPRADKDDAEPAEYTLQIEGAKKAHEGYDWSRKIIFQVTRRELPELAAFLLGYAGSGLRFTNHGKGHDKQLELKEQGHNLFVRLVAMSHPVVALPVAPHDLFAWGELALTALHLNRPHVSPEAQLQLLRRMGSMIAASGEPQ